MVADVEFALQLLRTASWRFRVKRSRPDLTTTNPLVVVVLSCRPPQPTSRRADARSSFRRPPWLPRRRACWGDNRKCCQAVACAEAAPSQVRSGEGARAPAPNLDLMAVRAKSCSGRMRQAASAKQARPQCASVMAHKALKQMGPPRSICARFAGVCASGCRPQGCMHGCHLKCRVPGAWRAARADPSSVVQGPVDVEVLGRERRRRLFPQQTRFPTSRALLSGRRLAGALK